MKVLKYEFVEFSKKGKQIGKYSLLLPFDKKDLEEDDRFFKKNIYISRDENLSPVILKGGEFVKKLLENNPLDVYWSNLIVMFKLAYLMNALHFDYIALWGALLKNNLDVGGRLKSRGLFKKDLYVDFFGKVKGLSVDRSVLDGKEWIFVSETYEEVFYMMGVKNKIFREERGYFPIVASDKGGFRGVYVGYMTMYSFGHEVNINLFVFKPSHWEITDRIKVSVKEEDVDEEELLNKANSISFVDNMEKWENKPLFKRFALKDNSIVVKMVVKDKK